MNNRFTLKEIQDRTHYVFHMGWRVYDMHVQRSIGPMFWSWTEASAAVLRVEETWRQGKLHPSYEKEVRS